AHLCSPVFPSCPSPSLPTRRSSDLDLVQDGRSGFWEGRVTGAAAGQFYKYRIYAANGTVTEHCDPYGFAMELRPGCCSVLTDPRSEEHTSELQSRFDLVCRLLLENK